MAVVATKQQEGERWDELGEEDGGYFVLPPINMRPKENYCGKAIKNHSHGDNKKVNVNLTALISGLESSSISTSTKDGSRSKFGKSVKEDAISRRSRLTMIVRERLRAPGNEAEEPYAFGDPLVIPSKGVLRMVCRICGEDNDHWSFKCPNIALQTKTFAGCSSTEPPICQVCEKPIRVMKHGSEEASVRLINLPKETCESDLVDLVRRFGPLICVSLSMDEKAGSTRKFAVVEYGDRKDAEKAIGLLNGYDYYNAILQAEWVTPCQEATYPSVCPSCMEASESCVHVSNISEKITGRDFLDLFARCGLLTVAYLDGDKMTGSQTKFGIVEYFRKVDAEKAIRLLNGFDIFDLKLRVQGPFRLQDLHRDLGV